MTEPKQIGIEEASRFLKVSPRTLRRYAKDKKLDHTYVKGKYGEELRFSETSVKAFAKSLSQPSGNPSQPAKDIVDQGSAPLEIKTVWEAYQKLQEEFRNSAAQIGFLRAKSEEVPRLTEHAESLQKENEKLLADTENLQEEKSNLEAEFGSYKKKMKSQSWLTSAFVVLAFLLGIFLSILLSDRISNLLPIH
jgi:hypothetical protein